MRRQLRVLIVDDEEDICFLMREMFEAAGHHVRTAMSTSEAREQLKMKPADVVLIDTLLPQGGGTVFADWIRDHFLRTTVVLTTAHPDETSMAHGYLVVRKPLQSAQDIANIESQARTRAHTSQPFSRDPLAEDRAIERTWAGPRFLLQRRVRIVAKDQQIPASSLNVSTTGCCLVAGEAVVEGQEIALMLYLDPRQNGGPLNPLSAIGRVCWTLDKPDVADKRRAHVAGVRFSGLADKDRQRLADFLKDMAREEPSTSP